MHVPTFLHIENRRLITALDHIIFLLLLTADERPDLLKLLNFPGKSGNISIPQQVGAKYFMLWEHSVEVGHKCLLGCGSVMWYLDPHSQELDGIVSNEWDGLSIYQELRVYQFPCRSLSYLQTLALIPDHCSHCSTISRRC